MPSNWYPGLNAQGYKVVPEPSLFAQTPALQKGKATSTFTITQPGTAGPGTAVLNNTGVDCLVIMSASGGIGGVSTSAGTATTGTVVANGQVSVPVLAGASVTVNYTTALTWHWLPI
jgi:hypothetical protein